MRNVVVIGTSGHAKVIVDILKKDSNYRLLGCLAHSKADIESFCGIPVLGEDAELSDLVERYQIHALVIGVGDNFRRSQIAARIQQFNPGVQFARAIHPQAIIAEDVQIGEGSVVMAGTVINSGCQIGRHCIVNSRASLDHDSILEDFSSLAPGVTSGGDCHIEQFSAVNIGAILAHGVTVGRHSVVGAGSLLLQSVESHVVAYGSPAKVIRTRQEGEPYL